ncbi:unnamed protein product [Vicia faba]|uniref:Uncharacterized protein n=1 Tax=Vicia faba TaxID=3906 RepID=A0AAV0YQE4_VICFA|nr:unnamed protein product [Vicia faba]
MDSRLHLHRAVDLHAFLYVLISRSHEEDEKKEVPDLTGICCHSSSGVSTWFQGLLTDEDKNVSKQKMKALCYKLETMAAVCNLMNNNPGLGMRQCCMDARFIHEATLKRMHYGRL